MHRTSGRHLAADRAVIRAGERDEPAPVRAVVVHAHEVHGDFYVPPLILKLGIVNVHARKLKLEPELDLQWIARGTPGFSGAELANLMNEAAIAATRDDSEAIGRELGLSASGVRVRLHRLLGRLRTELGDD